MSHFDPRIHPSNGIVQSQKEGLPNKPSSWRNTRQRCLYMSSSGNFLEKERTASRGPCGGGGLEERPSQPFLPGRRTEPPIAQRW